MDNKLRLMVIDDEPIVGKRLQKFFEKSGYIVESFTDSASAVSAIENNGFDIIITDLKMEGIDGIDILEVTKKKDPNTQVIIITGFSRRYTAVEAINKGAFDFIIKPFKINDLREVVKKAADELTKNRENTP